MEWQGPDPEGQVLARERTAGTVMIVLARVIAGRSRIILLCSYWEADDLVDGIRWSVAVVVSSVVCEWMSD